MFIFRKKIFPLLTVIVLLLILFSCQLGMWHFIASVFPSHSCHGETKQCEGIGSIDKTVYSDTRHVFSWAILMFMAFAIFQFRIFNDEAFWAAPRRDCDYFSIYNFFNYFNHLFSRGILNSKTF